MSEADKSTGGLNIVVESVGPRAVVLHLAGELDMVTAPGFAEHVQQHVAGGPSLVLDLSGVTFLGSAGLAVLAEARNLAVARAVQVRVVAASRNVLRPMEVTGLDKVLTVVPDVATAIEQVGE
ncbi:MAG TPA: STAS domain-containing protein [Pseudonocardiaceae bacterium]